MKIVLASKSGVRKDILSKNQISCEVYPSNVDEDEVKNSLISAGSNPLLISKNLAELKANKVSSKKPDEIVLGADSVIDLNGKLISKPKNRDDALNILKKLNGKKHQLIVLKQDKRQRIVCVRRLSNRSRGQIFVFKN